VLKIRDLPLRYVDDPVLSERIALSFEYKNDEAICLPQTTGHHSSRANWQRLLLEKRKAYKKRMLWQSTQTLGLIYGSI
jgi:hypothetical protein